MRVGKGGGGNACRERGTRVRGCDVWEGEGGKGVRGIRISQNNYGVCCVGGEIERVRGYMDIESMEKKLE